MLKQITVAAAVLVAATPALGADSGGQFRVRGVGVGTCQQFLDAVDKKDNALYLFGGWLDGYLTGVNQFSPETFDIAPWESTETLASLVRANCAKNPKQNFHAMLNAMVTVLRDRRLQERSTVVTATVGDQSIKLYKDVLSQMQAALAKSGFDPGAQDGTFGDQTRSAIEAYQKDKGFKVTGLPDQITLLSLLLPIGESE